MRHKYKVLQTGNFVPISAEHDDGWHTHVMAFARVQGDEIAIIAINFNDHLVKKKKISFFYLFSIIKKKVKIHLNLKNLKFLFDKYEDTDMVVKVNDWLSSEPDKSDYFTVAELIEDKHFACLNVIKH